MERAPKKAKEKETNEIFDFVFRNAMGMPILFASEPTASQMKANTWGKVKSVNTAMYVKFADGGTIKFTGTELA